MNPLPEGDRPVGLGFVRDYEDIFIKVKKWGAFEGTDMWWNISGERERYTPVPDFVANLEQELDSKPGLDSDAFDIFEFIRNSTANTQFLDAYFGRLNRRTVEGKSSGEYASESQSEPLRLAGYSEVVHLVYIATGEWERFWKMSLGVSLKEPLANAMFFQYFTFQVGGAITAQTGHWPFNIIARRSTSREGEQLRKFLPRCSFFVSKLNLPRLLVEVNSKPKQEWPSDLVQLLLSGAAVVRFANKFLDRSSVAKDFVLFAIYIWDDGTVTRYSLYQEPNNPKFVRQLYNLVNMLERDEETEDTEAKIEQLQRTINSMKSFNSVTKDAQENDIDNRSTGEGAGAVGATDYAELGAHGYEVEPQDIHILDEEWDVVLEPLFKMPSHILTVYQRSVPSKKFIAKKVREQSNELEIFEFLDTFQPKSEHIISLHESFQAQSTSWAILPEMIPVTYYVDIEPNKLNGKAAQVCWGLIKGVAYLHRLCIAHRDIKPNNLVVDGNFSVKIIDFDLAIRVKDEDEEVDDQCGTEGWKAPEVEKELRHSPIKADRWSTGQVLLYLLNNYRGEDTVLRTTARKLTADDPDQRPSMLQVAESLSDVVNVTVKRKALRSLQDTVEVDGENAKPPNSKKLRPDGPES